MASEGVTATGGRLTDDVTIGLLATTFPPTLVDSVIEATGRRERRDRVLPARLMVYLSMALWLDPGKGYVPVLRSLLSGLRWAQGWDGRAVPTDGAVSRGRDRLGSAPMKALFEATARPTPSPGHGDVFWRGLRKVAVDGTVFDLPASPDNAAAFAVPSGGTLPQARLVALAECASLAPLGAAVDSVHVDERALLGRLLSRLPPDALLLADRGFLSWEAYASAAATGAQLLWRASELCHLPVRHRLPDGTYLSELRGTRGGDAVTVRVIEYDVRADDGTRERFVLVTTLTSPEEAPAMELARIHACRWNMDVVLRLTKVNPRRPRGALRSRTAEGVRQELWALLCVYQALRRLVGKTAAITDVDPDRICFPPVPHTVENAAKKASSP